MISVILRIFRYGICHDRHPYYIVMEFCEHGSLKTYLEKFKSNSNNSKAKVIDKKRNPPEFSELKEWCEHIASGMTGQMNFFCILNVLECPIASIDHAITI